MFLEGVRRWFIVFEIVESFNKIRFERSLFDLFIIFVRVVEVWRWNLDCSGLRIKLEAEK